MSLHETLKFVTDDAFVDLIQSGIDMRKSQREYFKLRTIERLYAAKDAEDRFDRALRAVANAGNPIQPNLL